MSAVHPPPKLLAPKPIRKQPVVDENSPGISLTRPDTPPTPSPQQNNNFVSAHNHLASTYAHETHAAGTHQLQKHANQIADHQYHQGQHQDFAYQNFGRANNQRRLEGEVGELEAQLKATFQSQYQLRRENARFQHDNKKLYMHVQLLQATLNALKVRYAIDVIQ